MCSYQSTHKGGSLQYLLRIVHVGCVQFEKVGWDKPTCTLVLWRQGLVQASNKKRVYGLVRRNPKRWQWTSGKVTPHSFFRPFIEAGGFYLYIYPKHIDPHFIHTFKVLW